MSKKIAPKDLALSNFFITDQALNSAKFDEFGHVDYASLLEKLILEQPTPFNIGIFGRWGVGKSTIVNLLKERLEDDRKKGKIKILEVKVWKYDENSLRRKFIVKIAEGLGLEKDLDEINQDIYSDKEFETALLNFKDIISTILNKSSIALLGILFSLALLLIFRIINVIDVANPFWNTLFAKGEEIIIFPLCFSIIAWVFQTIKTAKLKLKIGKYDSEEQFENEFIKLIKKDKSKKVIFIDDLDRCSKEKVVKTLETIKTFLDVETCIFIIACDDEIIIDAINRSHELYNIRGRNEGAEYLEKFFQYTLYIPPFMIPDMRKYINTILKRNNSDLLKLGQTLEDIIFILINKDIKNPRNAITAINSFSSAYLLAKEREGDKNSRLHNKIITENLPILAIVTRIRYHFPEFHEDLLRNNDLIFWLIDILEGNKDQLTEKQIDTCEKYFLKKDTDVSVQPKETMSDKPTEIRKSIDWTQPLNDDYERLFHFLESIKDYLTIKNISAFLFLGIDSTSYLIGDEYLQEFNDSLKNGIDSKIEKILSSADENKREHLFDHICDWIQDNLEGVEQRKALQTLSKQLDKCPPSRIIRVSKTFSSFYNSRMKYEEFKKYHPSAIFKSARFVEPKKRHNLLTQSVSFLKNHDIEHDKIILNEVFKYESIIEDSIIIAQIRDYLDNRLPLTGEDGTELSPSIEFDFIKKKILQFKDNPAVLTKFFSGSIIQEVLDNLIENDLADSSPDNDSYKEAKQLFEILKDYIIIHNKKQLCECYIKLVDTTCYYEDLLEDIEKNIDTLPIEEIDSLAVKLIDVIPSYVGINNAAIDKIFYFAGFWLGKFSELSKGQILSHLVTQIAELIKNENEEIFKLGTSNYLKHLVYFDQIQTETLLTNFILKLNPQVYLERSNILKELILKDKTKISLANRQTFINQLLLEFNSIALIRDEVVFAFWLNLYNDLLDTFKTGDLDPLIMANSSTNLLSLSFPGGTNPDRARLCTIIIKGFDKISSPIQNNFFDLFSQFLNPVVKENAEYTIHTIYQVRSYINNLSFRNITIEMLINQFNIGIEEAAVLKNIQILYLGRELLTPIQISSTLQFFPSSLKNNPKEALDFFLTNWNDFPNSIKFLTIKNLLSTGILESKYNSEKILESIKTDYSALTVESIIPYLNELEAILKFNITERDLFAKIIKFTNTLNNNEFKGELRSIKIAEIKAELDIDLCRNKFSIIIGIKDKDYEKDRDINDLFFLLLNDNIDKKKLAIDVFEYYYEEKHPFSRKVELTELFNNLLEVFDHDYKITVKRLALKYDLKVKKSLFESIFG